MEEGERFGHGSQEIQEFISSPFTSEANQDILGGSLAETVVSKDAPQVEAENLGQSLQVPADFNGEELLTQSMLSTNQVELLSSSSISDNTFSAAIPDKAVDDNDAVPEVLSENHLIAAVEENVPVSVQDELSEGTIAHEAEAVTAIDNGHEGGIVATSVVQDAIIEGFGLESTGVISSQEYMGSLGDGLMPEGEDSQESQADVEGAFTTTEGNVPVPPEGALLEGDQTSGLGEAAESNLTEEVLLSENPTESQVVDAASSEDQVDTRLPEEESSMDTDDLAISGVENQPEEEMEVDSQSSGLSEPQVPVYNIQPEETSGQGYDEVDADVPTVSGDHEADVVENSVVHDVAQEVPDNVEPSGDAFASGIDSTATESDLNIQSAGDASSQDSLTAATQSEEPSTSAPEVENVEESHAEQESEKVADQSSNNAGGADDDVLVLSDHEEETSVVEPSESSNQMDELAVDAEGTPALSEDAPTPVAMTQNTANPEAAAVKPSQAQECIVCHKVGKCKYNIVRNGDIKHLCDDTCFKAFRAKPTTFLGPSASSEASATSPSASQQLSCSFCMLIITPAHTDRRVVIFGDVGHNFCSGACEDHYRSQHTACSGCMKAFLDHQVFTARDDNNKMLSFCSQQCLNNFSSAVPRSQATENDVEIIDSIPSGLSRSRRGGKQSVSRQRGSGKSMGKCDVCKKKATIKHEVSLGKSTKRLCSDDCFAAYRFANKLTLNTCENCGEYPVPRMSKNKPVTIQFEGQTKKFCGSYCLRAFKNKKEKLVPCAWCSTMKSNFDMIERVDASNMHQLFCSLNCLSLYRVNLQATCNQNIVCDRCKKVAPAQYHLTMSDASVRNFCSYQCVMAFQNHFAQQKGPAAPAPAPKTATQERTVIGTLSSKAASQANTRTSTSPGSTAASGGANVPVIANVMSLASPPPTSKAHVPSSNVRGANISPTVVSQASQSAASGTQTLKQKIIVQPPPPKQVKNKSLLCKPFVQTKATSCKPHVQSTKTQTEEDWAPKQVIIPVPVPIYVPVPMHMYTAPAPVPFPIPVPIPVPCFIPTTKKSSSSILKHIKEIQDRIPSDPFEAEMLMMAESLVNQNKDESSSDEDEEVAKEESVEQPSTASAESGSSTLPQNELGEDMLQIAIRMASEMPDEPLDVEDSLNPTPINPDDPSGQSFATIDECSDILSVTRDMRGGRGRKRARGGAATTPPRRSKRTKTEPDTKSDTPSQQQAPADANMVLKYTYGVNAWKHWVLQKNAQIEKMLPSERPRFKAFKLDVMQCTADELNYSLCLFVKEVRKPNGEEYAPDSIFYLCLGIQQYLLENGRIDNIFSDVYYEGFTEHLNEILARSEVRLNPQGLIVCRIEEEHLWEAKQLGAHSPHVLLNTLIYFNTKYFMLKTPDEHLRLSFSHIMKHWKKTNVPGTKNPGRAVYLRYYAPVPSGNDQKRKREEMPAYEQAENVGNPLRCPVKLYEFYLSKCPESIKNRNDVFYLIPERSCVPDSPVWYSTGSLGLDAMTKMLNRLRVVREIQEAHLHYQAFYTG